MAFSVAPSAVAAVEAAKMKVKRAYRTHLVASDRANPVKPKTDELPVTGLVSVWNGSGSP
jgi:hypothetical protein